VTREALIALAAAWLKRPAAAGKAREVLEKTPPAELARAARAHGLAAVALESAGRLDAAEEKLAPLREAARAEAARSLVLEAALAELAGKSREKGLAAVLVKGAALDHTAYPHPGLRPAADIDLLVKGQELAGWGELLAALGYRKFERVDRTWRRGEREIVDLHASSSDLAGVVDVPEELSPVRLDLGAIFERATRVEGLPLPAPGTGDQLLLAAAHGLGVHVFEKLVWLLDIAVLLGREPDPARLTEDARRSGAGRLLFHSLVLAGRLNLADPPGALLDPLRPERLGRLERNLLERLAREQLPDRAEFLLALALPASGGYKRALLRRALLPRARTLAARNISPLRGIFRHAARLWSMARLAAFG